jgi:hypothetical protein
LTNHRSFLNFGEFTIKGVVQLHQNGAAAAWPAEKNRLSVRTLVKKRILEGGVYGTHKEQHNH